jgi:predicted RNase H-like HicB family nuclease
MQVVALIHEGNGEFAAVFPDFPGIVAIAEDLDAVIAKAADVLNAEAARLTENGQELPVIRALSQIAEDSQHREDCFGAMAALVPLRPPPAVVRVTVALDEALLARADRAAEARGETRSQFFAEALRRTLDGAPAAPGADLDAASASRPAHVHQLMETIRRSIAVIDDSPH